MRDATSAASETVFTRCASGRIEHAAGLLGTYQYVFLTLASLAYFAITCYQAHRKLFWFDEIFTFYIARLPNIASIWAACTHGADFNPPLLYLLTRWSQNLFGATELATRLPQIIGFWIFCLCLYRFVSLRTNALAAFIALLFPLTAKAYWYAYDARSHGLVLGFFGLAFISWQSAANRAPHSWLPIAGLAASLTLAALCHCYAFILFIPLIFGELTRSYICKRINPAVWAALVLPALISVVTVLPLLHSVGSNLGSMAAMPSLANLWTGWDLTFAPPVAFLILMLLTIPASKTEAAACKFSWPETTALVVMLCTPFFAFAAAVMARAPIFGRYSLIATGAVACLIGTAAARSSLTGALVLILTVLFIGGDTAAFQRRSEMEEPSSRTKVSTRFALMNSRFDLIWSSAPGSEPVVLLNNITYAPMFHYAPPDLRSRLVFLTPEGPLSVLGETYQRLQSCCGAPGTVFPQAAFLAAHRTFYAYGELPDADIFRQLGGTVTNQGCALESCVLRIVFPAVSSAHE